MSIDMLSAQKPLTPDEAKQYSPLTLAFLGDSVYEVMVRDALLREANRPARELHTQAVAHVRASYQAAAVGKIADMLTEDESDILRRGRNIHSRHPVPKHQDPADYSAATALEALVGYLYITGQEERLLYLFDLSQKDEE